MKWQYLENRTGIEILEDIRTFRSDDYLNIRDLLLKHLIVVFRNQEPSSYEFARLTHNIGWGKRGIGTTESIHNWYSFNWYNTGEERYPGLQGMQRYRALVKNGYPDPQQYQDTPELYPVQRVTGKKNSDNVSTGIFAGARLAWHSNINGYDQADGVGLQGWEHCEGTTTEFLNTALCRSTFTDEEMNRLEGLYYNWRETHHNWSSGVAESFGQSGTGRTTFQAGGYTGPYRLWFLQQNRAGTKGFYYHYLNEHTNNGDADVDQWIRERAFKDQYRYVHEWQSGDIVLMDQIITLHQRDPRVTQEQNNRRVLHRNEFRLSNYDNYLRKSNVIVPGRTNAQTKNN
tara:strand:- start:188 stop:1219 length:1032 start_codon:yes stop_codon:yes gene_type:complete